jgi:hypothetical protein
MRTSQAPAALGREGAIASVANLWCAQSTTKHVDCSPCIDQAAPPTALSSLHSPPHQLQARQCATKQASSDVSQPGSQDASAILLATFAWIAVGALACCMLQPMHMCCAGIIGQYVRCYIRCCLHVHPAMHTCCLGLPLETYHSS